MSDRFGTDEGAMRRALDLAARGRGFVEPNPMVGAVLLDGGRRLIGEGFHERYGQPHAEANALRGVDAHGATLFVTLEPCAHHGKQPPCADAVVAAGVRRVVCAMGDPFAAVAGKGFAKLRDAGIDVDVGLLEADARELNGPFLKRVGTGRPYVIAKWAMTLDGKTATQTGHSKWISGEDSRRAVHELRGRVDAVIAGERTVAADDAELTARPPGPRTPTRVVIASRVRPMSETGRLMTSLSEGPVLYAHGRLADADRLARLRDLGVETLLCDDGSADGLPAVGPLLDELGRRGMTNVLVEGGAAVHGLFRDAGEVDEYRVYVSPKVIGAGIPAVSGPVGGLDEIPQTPNVGPLRVRQTGADLEITTPVPKPWRNA